MYIAITEKQILIDKNLNKLNNKYGVNFSQEDFHNIGGDFIVTLNQDNYDYVKDLRKISQIPIQLLFQADPMKKYIYAILALLVVILIRG